MSGAGSSLCQEGRHCCQCEDLFCFLTLVQVSGLAMKVFSLSQKQSKQFCPKKAINMIYCFHYHKKMARKSSQELGLLQLVVLEG